MAQSGHAELHCTCPLLGVKRTYLGHREMSANDPKRTLLFAVIPNISGEFPFAPDLFPHDKIFP
jgi:hypothetical protein